MLDTRLILIEGLPGAGKTTASVKIGKKLRQSGRACRWFLEEDDPHPIACLDFRLKDLPHKLPPLWRTFARQARKESAVTIIESRLWQNTALLMFMSEYPVEKILHLHQLVWQELTALSPVLLYLYNDDVERALRHLQTFREESWMAWALRMTSRYPWFRSRGLDDYDGWVRFFQEWVPVAECLYADWPFQKVKVEDGHDDWPAAYARVYRFLQVDEAPPGAAGPAGGWKPRGN